MLRRTSKNFVWIIRLIWRSFTPTEFAASAKVIWEESFLQWHLVFFKLKWHQSSISDFKPETKKKQQCITVGCVPSTAVAVGGGCLHWGGCLPGGCLPRWGVCPGGRGCLSWGVSARGLSAWGGLCPSACWDTHPCEQSDRHLWKHNLAATMLRTVKMRKKSQTLL